MNYVYTAAETCEVPSVKMPQTMLVLFYGKGVKSYNLTLRVTYSRPTAVCFPIHTHSVTLLIGVFCTDIAVTNTFRIICVKVLYLKKYMRWSKSSSTISLLGKGTSVLDECICVLLHFKSLWNPVGHNHCSKTAF